MRDRLGVVVRRARRRLAPARSLASRGATRLLTFARRMPLPPPVRNRVGLLRLRPGTRHVPVDRLLLGGQVGRSSQEFAEDTDQLFWGSTRILDSPHADLYRLLAAARARGDDHPGLMGTPYADHVRRCIAVYGAFLGATTEDEVRGLLDEVRRGNLTDRPGRSSLERRGDLLPRVRRIRRSDCYEIVDGHHRLAQVAVDGRATVEIALEWQKSVTPLQRHLTEMSWLGGKRELYQPIDAPELERGWPVLRACSDRWEKARAFLDSEVGSLRGLSALDVASAYGWFVARYAEAGMEAEGIERDPLAVPLGQAAYGVRPGAITIGDVVDVLGSTLRTWDVVSCFSLVHHFALGLGEVGADEVLRLLDRVTDRVLILDTGQAHEEWFAGRLDEWTDDGVAAEIRRHTSFTRVHSLGRDSDGVGPLAGNYGRMLFACTRD